MLSDRLHAAINEQINAELWSAYLYLSMSMDAANKGMKGIANWFAIQFAMPFIPLLAASIDIER